MFIFLGKYFFIKYVNLNIKKWIKACVWMKMYYKNESREFVTCAHAYFRMTVCQRASAVHCSVVEIYTFYNYFNQSQNNFRFQCVSNSDWWNSCRSLKYFLIHRNLDFHKTTNSVIKMTFFAHGGISKKNCGI